jgi:hypothetical protein
MPQTEKQKAAFEKARQTRINNLKKVWEAEQQEQQQQPQQPQQPQQQESIVESEPLDVLVEEEEEKPQPQPPVQVQVSTPAPVTPAPVLPQQEQDDVFELDVDDLYSRLQQNQKDIAEMREHLGSLRQGHDSISSQWQRLSGHGAEINYV